ncbi:MAG: class I SAM-dependent methyltransferase [Lacipirellulaceae bacterium]
MPDWPHYALLDFGADARGEGRRLERFGELVVDRPCAAAGGVLKGDPAAWRAADARYEGARAADGVWKPAGVAKREWPSLRVELAAGVAFALGVTPTPAGQVGVFPEQLEHWRWIAQRVRRAGRPLRVLNLFAYTGGSTLAAACAAGEHAVEVTHVDASKPSVDLARRNAELSGLAERPVRWLVEDALKYCQRELKRGSLYDGVILDPPSYGHGPKGEEWRFERDFPTLIELCRDLSRESRSFLLATCHTPGVGPAELSAYLSEGVVGHCGQPPASGRSWLATKDGGRLDCGVWARWPA